MAARTPHEAVDRLLAELRQVTSYLTTMPLAACRSRRDAVDFTIVFDPADLPVQLHSVDRRRRLQLRLLISVDIG
ncbi:MAG: hypothetical protein DCC58_17295 [Chloroflexi bacterium]|nr:MAG: hypothetical protein DCC58_17295 [Chloroflexota bacterium]